MQKQSKRKKQVAHKELERYMRENSLSQTALAEKLEVSQGLVWQWLNGITPISREKAKTLEEITGIPRMRLLYPEDRATG